MLKTKNKSLKKQIIELTKPMHTLIIKFLLTFKSFNLFHLQFLVFYMKKEFLCGMVAFALLSACAAKNEPNPAQQQEEVVQQVKDSKQAITTFNDFASKNAVYFAFDSSAVNENAIIKKYASQIKNLNDLDGVVLNVNGYCDNIGTVEYNNALGLRRAETVKSVIAKIAENNIKINTVSFGKNRYKIYTKKVDQNNQANRKVEIVASAN